MPLLCLLAACVVGTPQTVRLQLKFPRGRVDRMTTTTHMTESFDGGGGQKIQMAIDESLSGTITVLGSNSKESSVRMTYGDVKYSARMNGKSVPQSNEAVRLVKGKSLTITFAPDGRVLKVAGLKELMNGAFRGAPPQTRQTLEQMFSEDSVRQMWSMMFGGVIPRRPLRLGESWPTSFSFGQGPMALTFNLRMKLDSVAKGIATIGIGGTGKLAMSGFEGGASAKSNRISVTGTSKFDLVRGWLGDQKMAIKIDGAVQAKGQTVPFKMTESVSTRFQPVR